MKQKPTNELDDLLSQIKPKQLKAYLKENDPYMANGEKPFYHYMKDTIREKNMQLNTVYSIAGYSESYGGQILRMEKHTVSRDHIIRICVAAHFSWEETNRALKLYGLNELYSKDPRDACIIVAINNRRFDLSQMDDLLEEHGFQRLSKEEK